MDVKCQARASKGRHVKAETCCRYDIQRVNTEIVRTGGCIRINTQENFKQMVDDEQDEGNTA